jgi:ABC-type bacteriocin/lantibiotic exporter with double-glycine peptidase domain
MFTALEATAPLLGWAIVVYGSGLGMRGETPVSAGSLFAFSIAFQQIISATIQFGALLMSLAQIAPLLGWLRPLLDATPEFSMVMPDPGALTGAIELENVRF